MSSRERDFCLWLSGYLSPFAGDGSDVEPLKLTTGQTSRLLARLHEALNPPQPVRPPQLIRDAQQDVGARVRSCPCGDHLRPGHPEGYCAMGFQVEANRMNGVQQGQIPYKPRGFA